MAIHRAVIQTRLEENIVSDCECLCEGEIQTERQTAFTVCVCFWVGSTNQSPLTVLCRKSKGNLSHADCCETVWQAALKV